MTTPPVPAQRKVKLITALKVTQSEQTTKLQSKHQFEHELLEDIRSYTKTRATAEKDYAQALLKITSQMLGKFSAKDETKEEELRTPFGLWRKILEDTEVLANVRMKIAQTLQSNVAESIKTLKTERIVTVKKCSSLAERLHEEMQVSATDLSKSQKTYTDLEKLTLQAREQTADCQEKLRKGAVGLFSSKAKLEKNLSKANERKEVLEKRSTIARNDHLLTLSAINAHQTKYYSLDLPDLIAVQDGNIYEKFKEYYSVIMNAEKESCQQCIENIQKLEQQIEQLHRAYVIRDFLKQNPVFTKCVPYTFTPLPGDTITGISEEFGAGLPLNKEARKWTLRLAREQKVIKKKNRELKGLQAMSTVDTNITTTDNTDGKTTEQTVEGLIEEIRHLEVLRTKAVARVDAMKQAGVNVEQWLQAALAEQEDEETATEANEKEDFEDDDDFAEDEWDEPSKTNVCDDALSTSSSLDQRFLTTKVVAVYSFQATSQEELSIFDGEELDIIERDSDGWCKTRNQSGKIGYVPESYIEVKAKTSNINDDTTSLSGPSSLTGSVNLPDVIYQELPTPVVEEPIVETKPDYISFAKAVYDYEACEDEELSFQEGDVIMVISKMVDDDDGWWEGILGGKRGVFPSIVVEESAPAETVQDCPLTQSHTYITDPYSTIPRSHLGNKTVSITGEESSENT